MFLLELALWKTEISVVNPPDHAIQSEYYERGILRTKSRMIPVITTLVESFLGYDQLPTREELMDEAAALCRMRRNASDRVCKEVSFFLQGLRGRASRSARSKERHAAVASRGRK